MDEKLEKVKALLAKYGQEHLMMGYEKFKMEAKKEEFLDSILAIDFKQIKTLYEKAEVKPIFAESKIDPISYIDKYNLSKEERDEYVEIGTKAIKEGKLAVVTMAGGQGTRLGHSGPKGTFDLGLDAHKSIFEILTDTIKDAAKKYGVDIPWYIMTSEENNDETVNFFEDHNYFGYKAEFVTFFKQGKLPMLSTDGKVLLDEKGKIKLAADGHGGVFQSMKRDGIINKLSEDGVEWVFIGGVDNVLVKPVDALLMGMSIKQGVLASGKSIVKANPHEKVGVFCKRDGKPSVIEYSEISNEMAEAVEPNGELRYGESHILCNLFNVKALEKIGNMKLPYHIAFKKAKYMDSEGNIVTPEEPNAYKFESFLFDAFENLDDLAVLRVKREEEFAPVKNASGVDSPETARELYLNFHK